MRGRTSIRTAKSASTDRRAGAVDRRLVEALTSVVNADGYRAATVSRVTRAAGVSRSGFYGHYASIDALALAVLEDLLDDVGSADMAGRTALGADGRVLAGIALELLFESVLRNRALYRIVLSADFAGGVGPAIAAFASRVEPVIRLARPDQPDAKTIFLSYAVGGTIAGGIVRALEAPDTRTPYEWATELMAAMPAWLYPAREEVRIPGEGIDQLQSERHHHHE
jgi:AcrR family transcriptional regulator